MDIAPFCQNSRAETGGISFAGNYKTLYTVNLYSRTGMYVLVKLCEFTINNQKDLYYQIADYPWNDWINHDDTFSIRSRVFTELFQDPNIVTLQVKDAIVDRIRQKTKRRPDVDKVNPRYSIFVFIHDLPLFYFFEVQFMIILWFNIGSSSYADQQQNASSAMDFRETHGGYLPARGKNS